MLIKDIELDDDIRSLLIDRLGYTTLYPPQQKAIEEGLLKGESLLIATPTASGKTLIAMLASARIVKEGLGKVVYLTPLRALANEKYREFKILEEIKRDSLGLGRCNVMISTGDYDSSGDELNDADVIVLTYEKMDSLFRHRAEWIDDVRLYVFDEAHMLSDKERGATIEMIFARARMSSAQILALSATISNAKEIASWLNCKLIDTQWRPTRLIEGVYHHGIIYYKDGRRVSIPSISRYGAPIDLAMDTVKDNAQALIFTESRKRAVTLALSASEALKEMLTPAKVDAVSKYINALLEHDDSELAKSLAKAMGNLAAFHHAGLSPYARSIVEDAFRDGVIKVLTATPTLAAGVNLPARRVIIASISRYDHEQGMSSRISVNEYKQMCGRAGRPRYDDYGEAIIVSNSSVEDIFDEYINAESEPIRSTLNDERMLRRHILASIAMSKSIKESELYELFSRTLLARQYSSKYIAPKFRSSIEYLAVEGMINVTGYELSATKFGRRVAMLYIDPESAVIIKSVLTRINSGKRHGKLTLGLLHVITECPDFYPRLQLRSKDMDEAIMLIDEHADEFLDDVDEYSISRSLLALYAWIEEYSDKHLYENLGVEPGDMYRMIEVSDWLLYSMYSIAELLGKRSILKDIDILRKRVKYGVKEELIPLVMLEGIGRARARALFNAGFTDLKSIADASIDRLENVKGIGHRLAERIKEEATRIINNRS